MKKSNQTKVASVLSVAILLTGTFAWQSFSQMALNESSHRTNFDYEVGGRLHDHYDGENKDVFVENYADADDESDVLFARIRLDEYYEHGEGAGSLGASTEDITIVRGDLAKTGVTTPTITDVETWDTYGWGSIADSQTVGTGDDAYEEYNIRTYRSLLFGGVEQGSTVYMPTFNKNVNSLAPELNGTYGGTDGDRTTDYDRYGDYVVYTDGESSDATEVEYADPDDSNGYLTEPASVHVAKKTLSTIKVISMTEWVNDYNSELGRYWVYDTDGWAYWAQPIEPQTATGLLLDGVIVETASEDHEEWYYAVNVVCQIATAGDWGEELAVDSTDKGMYDSTAEGILLLNTIAAEYLPVE